MGTSALSNCAARGAAPGGDGQGYEAALDARIRTSSARGAA